MSHPVSNKSSFLGLPASGLAALPLCPACYPAYAGVLSALGLTGLESIRTQTIFTFVALAIALAALAYRASSRRGYRPLLLGVAGSLVALGGKLGIGYDLVTYVGVTVLFAASVWNVWPRKTGPETSEPRTPEMAPVS